MRNFPQQQKKCVKKVYASILVTNAFDNVNVPCCWLTNLLTNLISKDDVM